MTRGAHRKVETGLPVGIEARHARDCTIEPCTCTPSYRAWVYDKRTGKKVRKHFSGKGALAAAKGWRIDALSDLNRGKNIVPSSVTLRAVTEEWLAGAKARPPTVLNRSGEPFKPSAVRSYEGDLRRYVLPDFGASKLSEIRRGDLQRLSDRLIGQGLSGSKVRNVITAVKTVYRWAIDRELVGVNPTTGLRLPNGIKHRDRAASREETVELLSALPVDLRPIYATAAYAGLRRGELRGLRWSDVDLDGRRINVSRSWDDYEGETAPKSEAGTRAAPLPRVLYRLLAAHKLRSEKTGPEDFVFAGPKGGAFTSTNVRQKGLVAWKHANAKREPKDQLNPIGLHELRHTAISLWFAAGVRRETCEDWAGHSSGLVTDIYRHMRPEVFDSELDLVDEYIGPGVDALIAVA
jgi:integrase